MFYDSACLMSLHQHSIGYMGDSFTGQKTQPTVLKYWRKRRYRSKENQCRKRKQHKIQQ